MRAPPMFAILTLALLWAPPLEGARVEADLMVVQQATGVVTGTVRDATSMAPRANVQVSIPGTGLGTLTTAQGRFLIPNVPAGTHRVLVQSIGYATVEETVTVASGQTVALEFTLQQRALDLDEIVVTGTAGGQQRRAIGNVVASVNAAQVLEKAPVTNVNQLLGQRTPGLMLLPGTGQVGTGSAIRIRGNSSLSLSNEPIIYIDGVRMDSDAGRGPGQRGGSNVSRLNDINPNDIESIEIIKGPAAATLYGTEASNGVIQIITKRGTSGAPQYDFTARVGTNWLWNPAGRSGKRWMVDPNSPTGFFGFNAYENEVENGNGPIFGYGLQQGYNLGVRGGTDAVRYFVSVSRDDDRGIVDWNTDQRLALRGNTELLLSEKLTAVVATSYITGETRLVQGAINIDPFSNLVWATPRNIDTRSRGFYNSTPEEWRKVETTNGLTRSTSSIELRLSPVDGWTNRMVAGVDSNDEVNTVLYPQQAEGASHPFGQLALGSKNVTRAARRFVTVDFSSSYNWDRGDWSFQPSVGFQYYRTSLSSISAEGAQFPAVPITTVSGGASRNGEENFVENATMGLYIQQQVGWKNRAFLTAAVRGDDNSAFGTEYDAAIYPKLSGTWVVSEEDFWSFDRVDQFRLRAAWGAAGQQPGTFDASQLWSPTIGYQNQPALLPNAFGNPQLSPERGEELEVGFDASFLDGRVDLTFTRYQKAIKDAIVNRPLAPSSGFTGSQIVNIGEVAAWGNEVGVNVRLMERPGFQWELDTQFSTMENEIRDLGGEEFIPGAGQAQQREGRSISDFYLRRYISAELDANGNLVPGSAMCDGGAGPEGIDPGGAPVPCGQAPKVWLGHTQPTWQIGAGTGLTFWNNLRLYARVEGNGGHYQANTEIRATHNQGTSLVVLSRNDPELITYRAFENDATANYKAGFLRLREISANFDLPDSWVERVGARRAALSLGMRNVMMLWTAEHGWGTYRDGSIRVPVGGREMITWDPEVRSTGTLGTGYQTVLPPTASFTSTLRLSF
jgi:TonB-dependent starch-binding outer membrane protein SusC